MSVPARTGVSAEAYTAVVAAYADRVHDDVRRIGCRPADAVDVVEASALSLLDRLRTAPERVEDVVGAWFREARTHADRVVDALPPDGEDPAFESGAIVQQSAEDAASRDALARLGERDRMALLLRDSYDLPYGSVAVALLVDPGVAPAVVAHARLRFVAELSGEPVPGTSGHDADLGALALQTDGRLPAARQRALADHLAECQVCADAAPALRRARQALRGLSVMALPDEAREALLDRVGTAARRVLPAAAAVEAALAAAEDDDEERRRLPSLTVVAGSLVLAAVLGTAVGVATTGGSDGDAAAGPGVPTPFTTDSPSPSTSASASLTPSATPTTTRSPSPRPTVTRSGGGSASPSPSVWTPAPGSQTIALDPTRGPDCTLVTVTGRNWPPGRRVTITYRDIVGSTPLGPTAVADPDAEGRFRTSLYACDPAHIPGPHVVRADNGSRQRDATFTAG